MAKQVTGIRYLYQNIGLLAGILFPVTICAAYMFFLATPRYVSEAQFVVRQAAANQQFSGLSSFLKSTGLGSGADEASIIKAYILSRTALQDLEKDMSVRAHYEKTGADFLSRWPSLLYGDSSEEFYRYFRRKIEVRVDSYTGVIVLRVQAFSPKFAQDLASRLISLSEKRVNQINERVLESTLAAARSELERSEDTLSKSQVAMALFRQGELTLDPTQTVTLFGALLAQLNSELSEIDTAIQNLRKTAPNSPRLPGLVQGSKVIKDRISAIKLEYSSEETGYTKSISEFERLQLQHEFALRRLAVAITSYSSALSEAQQQRLFLERFVSPNLPDRSTEPKRLVISITVFGWSCLLYLVAWLMISGLREHAIQD